MIGHQPSAISKITSIGKHRSRNARSYRKSVVELGVGNRSSLLQGNGGRRSAVGSRQKDYRLRTLFTDRQSPILSGIGVPSYRKRRQLSVTRYVLCKMYWHKRSILTAEFTKDSRRIFAVAISETF